nr:putative ribosomal protein L35 [Ipomoea batatas]
MNSNTQRFDPPCGGGMNVDWENGNSIEVRGACACTWEKGLEDRRGRDLFCRKRGVHKQIREDVVWLSLESRHFMQVRHITAKQKKRKLKSRKPMTPVVSKVKKIKIKGYSSFKDRFRVMKDGQIRRWKEGKRHNAHLKINPIEVRDFNLLGSKLDGSSVVVGYRGCLVVLDFSTVDSILKPALVTVLDLTCPFLCSHKLLDSSAMLQLYCTFVSFWTGWQDAQWSYEYAQGEDQANPSHHLRTNYAFEKKLRHQNYSTKTAKYRRPKWPAPLLSGRTAASRWAQQWPVVPAMGSGRRPLLILGEQHSGGSSGRRPPPSCFDGSYGVRRLAAAASSRCPLPAIGTSDLRAARTSLAVVVGGSSRGLF